MGEQRETDPIRLNFKPLLVLGGLSVVLGLVLDISILTMLGAAMLAPSALILLLGLMASAFSCLMMGLLYLANLVNRFSR